MREMICDSWSSSSVSSCRSHDVFLSQNSLPLLIVGIFWPLSQLVKTAKVLQSGWNWLHASVNCVCHIYRDLSLADLFPCCLSEWSQKQNGNNEGSRSFYTSNLQSIRDWNYSEGSFCIYGVNRKKQALSVTILFLCLLSFLQILAGWWWNYLEWNGKVTFISSQQANSQCVLVKGSVTAEMMVRSFWVFFLLYEPSKMFWLLTNWD